jgi:triosephosphate isomerase
MPKIFVSNWKMNPQSFFEAESLLKLVLKFKTPKIKIILCPPFVWLRDLILKSKNKIEFGAQNMFFEEKGAFTGEISCKMLKNIGVKYVILGHSERRNIFRETDEAIRKKVITAVSNNLVPILCVGENLNTRKKGKKIFEKFVLNQLESGLGALIQNKIFGKEIIIAYEPVWAISGSGLGIADTPENAKNMISLIKNFLFKNGFKKFLVLYGGSVNSSNILNFLSQKEIDGALVGSASVNFDEFSKMIQILNKGLKNK